MDPHFQHPPPKYFQIQQHRSTQQLPLPQVPIEVNKMGPTIQQGMIQCLVQRSMQSTVTGAWPKNAAPLPMYDKQQEDCQVQITSMIVLHQIQERMEETDCQNMMRTQIIMAMY